jgi:hypothetical protein
VAVNRLVGDEEALTLDLNGLPWIDAAEHGEA